MKVAIVGSRGLSVPDIGRYLPEGFTEIVSGGAKGIDTCARYYAVEHGIPLREFLPDYQRYGATAPLRRNDDIIAYADAVVALWDGASHGTYYVIARCRQIGKQLYVYQIPPRQK